MAGWFGVDLLPETARLKIGGTLAREGSVTKRGKESMQVDHRQDSRIATGTPLQGPAIDSEARYSTRAMAMGP